MKAKVKCAECGHKFLTAKEIPYCPRCNSADCEPVEQPKPTVMERNGEVFCPYDASHTLSADAEPRSYYCYECGEHYRRAAREARKGGA